MVNDFKSVFHDPNGHQFLTVVPAVHHQGVDEPLHDRTLGLPEPFSSKPASTVGKVPGILLLHSDVVLGDMSETDTSSQLHLPKRRICGNSGRTTWASPIGAATPISSSSAQSSPILASLKEGYQAFYT